MKAFIATNIIGSFAFDANGDIVHYVLFPTKPEYIAERLERARRGEIIHEEESLIKDLIEGGTTEVVWDKKVDFPGVECKYEAEHVGKATLQRDVRKLALDLQWVNDQTELNQLMSSVSIMMTKKELRKPKKDRILMHAIGVTDELDRVINTLSERMREWYGLYYPEACRLVPSHEALARMISEAGERDRIKDKQLEKYANVSAGMPFSEGDMKSIQEYAKAILSLYGTREYVAEYVRTEGKNVIPNLSAVAGPLIAFRLVALAGGLEKLAKMSSSTVQLLGAEKALFRHLRGQGRAPKFGVIFAHQAVQNAPRDDKGRVARTLASKLSLAARADFYTGKNISDKLISDFKKKSTGGHKPKKKAKSI